MKNNKKNLIGFAEKNGWKYPRIWMIFTFSFTGSFIGALIIGIFFLMPDIIVNFQNLNFKDVIASLFAPILIGFVGWVFGIIPAFLTALYVALTKFIIVEKKSYWLLCYVGVLSTALYIIGFLTYNNVPKTNTVTVLSIIGFLIVGGISAMVCGKWFVPKLSNFQKEN